MLQRLLDTVQLSGSQWVIVIALSLITPALMAADKLIQISAQKKERAEPVSGLSPQVST